MFFIGITGQLITLLLTVCLPFVFLVSSQPKMVFPNKTVGFENHKNLQSANSGKIKSLKTTFNFDAYRQNIKIEIENVFIRKIPLKEFRVKLKSFHAESSGNKAPPVIH